MATREARFIANSLRPHAKAAAKAIGQGPRPVPPGEQMRRFLDDEEFARVESGEITPTQYQRYRVAMLKKLGAV